VKAATREKLEKVSMHSRVFGFWDTLRYGLINLMTPTRGEELVFIRKLSNLDVTVGEGFISSRNALELPQITGRA